MSLFYTALSPGREAKLSPKGLAAAVRDEVLLFIEKPKKTQRRRHQNFKNAKDAKSRKVFMSGFFLLCATLRPLRLIFFPPEIQNFLGKNFISCFTELMKANWTTMQKNLERAKQGAGVAFYATQPGSGTARMADNRG